MSKIAFFGVFAAVVLCCGAALADGGGEPHLLQKSKIEDSCVMFRTSGRIQENDCQYVHDIFCDDTGEKIGTVRMRWGFKYGSRYGGVGTVTEGDIECVWQGDMGWVKIRIKNPGKCQSVTVVPRIAKIAD